MVENRKDNDGIEIYRQDINDLVSAHYKILQVTKSASKNPSTGAQLKSPQLPISAGAPPSQG